MKLYSIMYSALIYTASTCMYTTSRYCSPSYALHKRYVMYTPADSAKFTCFPMSACLQTSPLPHSLNVFAMRLAAQETRARSVVLVE